MAKRRINFTIEIDNNDEDEHVVVKALANSFGSALVDYQVLPDTKSLYEKSEQYREMVSKKSALKKKMSDFVYRAAQKKKEEDYLIQQKKE